MDLRGLEKPRLSVISANSSTASSSAAVSKERNAAPSEPQEHPSRRGRSGRSNIGSGGSGQRTCIFSVGHLDNLEDVDTLLQALKGSRLEAEATLRRDKHLSVSGSGR